MSRRAVLLATMEEAYTRLRDRLEGLTDEEFFWQPVPNAWTIYEDTPGHWTYHYEIPDPDPAPVTTIAWQVVHLATTRFMYHEWAYGDAKLTFPELEIPRDVEGAVAFLQEGYETLRLDLDHESGAGLDQPRKTNWGEMWPAWRIFTAMTDHDALHTGAIGLLRDLYHWTARPHPPGYAGDFPINGEELRTAPSPGYAGDFPMNGEELLQAPSPGYAGDFPINREELLRAPSPRLRRGLPHKWGRVADRPHPPATPGTSP